MADELSGGCYSCRYVLLLAQKLTLVEAYADTLRPVCLAHFLLVVGGFTGNRGYEKVLAVEKWLSGVLGAPSD